MIKNQNEKGFSVFVLLIILAVIGLVGFVSLKVFQNLNKSDSSQPEQSKQDLSAKSSGSGDTPDTLPKNIGFNLGTYDPATKQAGDFRFSAIPALSDPLVNNRLWNDYGDKSPKPGDTMRNPQTVFLLPAGTNITSMIDGEVVSVQEFGNNDYGVMIAKDSKSKWRYEHEHISDVQVKQGEKVKAGQVIAKVGQHTNSWQYPGYGLFEIGLYRSHPNGVGGSEDCIFKFLDQSVKQDIQAKVTGIYTAWEEFRGDTSIYDQENYASPGCVIEETISWEQPMVAPSN